MKPFRFRLHRVLRVRRLVEEAARGDLAIAEGAARAAEHAKGELTEQVMCSLRESRERRSKDRLAPDRALLDERVTESLRQSLAVVRARATALRTEVDRVHELWSERRRDVEGLERLRERALAQYRNDEQLAERAETDEANSARVTRQLKGSRPVADEPDHGRSYPSQNSS